MTAALPITAEAPLAHAKFSASGSGRWLACPASIQMEEGLPDTTSEAAAEGTLAHYMGEQALRSGRSAHEVLLEVPFADVVGVPEATLEAWDSEMADYVQIYLDYVRQIPGELFVETRVNFSHVVPGGFGTSDALVFNHDTGQLHVVDLKYGKGHRVLAERNTQLGLYALGAINDLSWLGEIKSVVLVVVQPRLDHIDEWEVE